MMTSRRVWALTLIMASATLTTAAAGDLKFLPSDTEMVFTINVKQILGSQLLQANKEAVRQAKQELENQAAGNPAMKLLQKAGFDIFRDLHKITVTSDGSKEPTGIIVEGNFDKDKLAAATAEIAKENRDALAITKSGKQTIYEITPPGDKAFYATLANENVMIAVSTRKGLTDALDRLAGDQKANLKKEFAALLNGSDGKQSIFFVATGTASRNCWRTRRSPMPAAPRLPCKRLTAWPSPSPWLTTYASKWVSTPRMKPTPRKWPKNTRACCPSFSSPPTISPSAMKSSRRSDRSPKRYRSPPAAPMWSSAAR